MHGSQITTLQARTRPANMVIASLDDVQFWKSYQKNIDFFLFKKCGPLRTSFLQNEDILA
jgi:hypothetical protein